MSDIDIVIPWVDGGDVEWQKEFKRWRARCTGRDDNSEIRYRDWGSLQYLFRGIEKFAPWVRKVHLITTGQRPEWLNMEAPKLNFVKHEDFIPGVWLPTFSVRPIELNLHRIEGLSERFVYFNDDYFLLRPVKEERFFKGGVPCDMAILDTLPIKSDRAHMVMNDMRLVYGHFDKWETLRRDPWKWFNLRYGGQLMRTLALMPFEIFPGLRNHHLPQAFLKSTYREVWQAEGELLSEVSGHRFRDITDVNQYVFRYWQLLSGGFRPINIVYDSARYEISERQIDKLCSTIRHQRRDILVTYDTDKIEDFETLKNRVNSAFESILPERSSFEK